MIHVGFTGTSNGCTPAQLATLSGVVAHLFLELNPPQGEEPTWTAHHGCCIGADLEFGNIARTYNGRVIGHPGPDGIPAKDALLYALVRTPLPHMRRNKNIVDACSAIIACPPTELEQARGGTWATIRMARKAKKPICVITPVGLVLPSAVPWPWKLPDLPPEFS